MVKPHGARLLGVKMIKSLLDKARSVVIEVFGTLKAVKELSPVDLTILVEVTGKLCGILFAELNAKVNETPTEVVTVDAVSVHSRVDAGESSDAEGTSLVKSVSEVLHAVLHVEFGEIFDRAGI